jgi:hypothetical protein
MRGWRPPPHCFHCWDTAARLRQHSRHTPACDHLMPYVRACSTKQSDRWRRFQNRIQRSDYEQHCLGTPNSGRSYARRAHASRSCPRSRMSPSVGSILGEQGQQPADQCRLYARQHRTGAQSTRRNSVFDTDTRSPML